MPTKRKIESVEHLRQLIEKCTIIVAADYTGMSVDAMTELRRALRGKEVDFRVVKNRLSYLAADAAGKPILKEIITGPTGLALGFGEPVEPPKVLSDFIANTRYPLKLRGGVLGDRVLSDEDLENMAQLSSKDELIAQLAGLLQGPVTTMLYVLNAPISGLARVLQRHVESISEEEQT